MGKSEFTKEDTLAMKGVAIIVMFYHHCFLSKDRFAKFDVTFFPLPEHVAITLSYFCKICVGLFVFLSAYGMTISLKNALQNKPEDRKTFELLMGKRYISLMMGYWFVFIMGILSSLILRPQLLTIYTDGFHGIWTFLLDFFGVAFLFGADTLIGTWWYMGLAITLIFAMPMLYLLCKRFGVLAVLLAGLVPSFFGIDGGNYARYLLCIMLGIFFAQENLLVRIRELKFTKSQWLSKCIKLFFYVIVLVFCIKFRSLSDAKNYYFLHDSIIPMIVICFCNEFILHIKGLRWILVFFGKHSMNMFLFHTFIRVKFFSEFTYSFKSAWLILLILLLDSAFISVVFEWIKKLIRYEKWTQKLLKSYEGIVLRG